VQKRPRRSVGWQIFTNFQIAEFSHLPKWVWVGTSGFIASDGSGAPKELPKGEPEAGNFGKEPLEAPFFYGQYERSLDPKNRMLVPAEILRRIKPEVHGKDFFLIVGQNRRPWLYPDKFYEELVTNQKSEVAPGAEASDFDRMSLGLAQLVELDNQNRILIPVRSMVWAGLQQTKEFYLVGVRDHLELWERGDWENERKALMERGPEIVARARQARQAP
jgi:MraZ protein